MKVYKDKQKLYFNIEDKETVVKMPYQEEKNYGDSKQRTI
jgi:hypothetical protein